MLSLVYALVIAFGGYWLLRQFISTPASQIASVARKAGGIALISAPLHDAEGLFRRDDFLRADNGEQMTAQLRRLQHDPELAAALSARGLETIRSRHTCGHRVDELLAILAARQAVSRAPPTPQEAATA